MQQKVNIKFQQQTSYSYNCIWCKRIVVVRISLSDKKFLQPDIIKSCTTEQENSNELQINNFATDNYKFLHSTQNLPLTQVNAIPSKTNALNNVIRTTVSAEPNILPATALTKTITLTHIVHLQYQHYTVYLVVVFFCVQVNVEKGDNSPYLFH